MELLSDLIETRLSSISSVVVGIGKVHCGRRLPVLLLKATLVCVCAVPGTMQAEAPRLFAWVTFASMPIVVAALRQRYSDTLRALKCRVCGRILGRAHYSNSQWKRHRDRPQCIACTTVQYGKGRYRVQHDDDEEEDDEEEDDDEEEQSTDANPRSRRRDHTLLRTTHAPYWGKRLRPNNWGYTTHLDALWGKACFTDIVRLGVFPDAKDASEAMCALRAATAFGNIGLGCKKAAGQKVGGSGDYVGKGDDENKKRSENSSGMRAHHRACRTAGVACVCIGDGATPRCAALVSYLTKWQAFCVDPGLRVEFCGDEPKGIKRLNGSRSTLEAWLGPGQGEGPEGPAHSAIRNAAAKQWTHSTACSTMCTSEIGAGGVEPFRWRHLVLLCVHSHHRFIGDASIERVRAAFGSPNTCLVALPCCHRFHPHKDLGGVEPDMVYDDAAVFSACRRVLVYNWEKTQRPRSPPVVPPMARAQGTSSAATCTAEDQQVPASRSGSIVQMKPTAAGLFLTGPEEKEFSLDTLDGTKDDFDQRYKLGKQLGQGHYSVVKDCVHCETGEVFAVKIMKKSKMADEDCVALKQEIALLKSLRHPNIITLHEHFEDDAHYYLVTEKCAGGEIFDRIVEREFYSELKARNVARALLQAIEYCHDHDVVHRDLKPENLLLTSREDDESFKIADFGFGKRSVGLASRGDHNNAYGLSTQCGTPGYIAPEILEGQRYGKGVDIWSAGIITYILLCGYPPFHDDDLKQLFRKIRKGEYEFDSPFWDEVSNAARNFVRRMLVVQQDKRATAHELLQDPWILDDGVSDANNELAIKGLRLWNAKRKFRAAVKTIVATNRIRKLTAALGGSEKAAPTVPQVKAKGGH